MLQTVFRIVVVFIAYSIFGAAMEHVAYTLGQLLSANAPKKAWINPVITGFPLYGLAALYILFAKTKIVEKYKLSVGAEFLLYSTSITLIELLTGYYVGAGKNSHLANGEVESWDYSNNFLNFDGKIDVLHAIVYGFIGLFIAKIGF